MPSWGNAMSSTWARRRHRRRSGLLAAVGTLLLTIQGLAIAHRISLGKAAFAVLLPAVLCCGCLIILAVTMGAALFHHMVP